MTCPICKAKPCKSIYTHPTNPVHDVFQCKECKVKFNRYQGTIYERKGDPRS